MPFQAKVFKILIASPGDVDEERQAIPEIIARWNALNAESNSVVLLPVRWETSSAPLLGDRAQSVINNQMVTSCDMAIGVFWTRLGSPTGASESGTAEEIEWFIKNSRPVMVYFSSREVNPKSLDINQYSALKDFEKRMQKIGLTGSYSSIADLREQLLNQISINVRTLISGQPIPIPTVATAKAKAATIEKMLNRPLKKFPSLRPRTRLRGSEANASRFSGLRQPLGLPLSGPFAHFGRTDPLIYA